MKPFNIRSQYDYTRAKAILKQLQNTISRRPDNSGNWDYQYSAEKLAYTFVLNELTKQENYFKNKMKAYRDKFPEQFI
jgi:hypothetical protein